MEEYLVEALCFDFDITHPYDEVVQLVRRFVPRNSALENCAWAFVNDRYEMQLIISHRTVMQIHNVSFAYDRRRFTKTEIPRSAMDGKEWWEEYGVKIEHLRGIPLSGGALTQTRS